MRAAVRSYLPWTVAVLLGLGPVVLLGNEPQWVKEADVKIPMSDGVNLAADIYRPRTGSKFPTVFVRTPYDKRSKEGWLVPGFVKNGYAVVIQDVRGMNGSEGTFIPFLFDKKDGLETLTWISGQPWSDGKIGMWGSSYLSYCALILAPENHPNLKAVFNVSGWASSSDMTAPGGALHLMVAAPWTLSRQIHGKGSFGAYSWDKAFRHVPVTEIPSSLGVQSPQWEAAVALFSSEEAMAEANAGDAYDKVRIPVFHLTGWYDFVGRFTVDAYEGIADQGAGAPPQRMVVGPWRHDQIWTKITKVGDEDFGPDIIWGVEKVVDLANRWFDRWLKGEKNGIEKEKPVQLFVMGANEWQEFDRWPPRSVELQKWHLASEGRANTANGDGRLATAGPMGAAADTFLYDPFDPVPTFGGANCHFFLDNLGIKDQRDVEAREDVLVYTSEPMTQDTSIIGPLRAVVYASTEGKHTDFTAKLVEVRSDGYARIVEEGIRRGPDAIDGQPVEFMEPDKVYRFTIDLGATAIRISRGHRLRVEVSSSNFPKYTRNPNTGENPETATEFVRVKQTIHHSKEYPSHVVLPVVR